MNNMPLLSALKQFVNKKTISLHVPGHKNGTHSFINELNLPDLLKYDVTELSGLDDLHYPTEAIKDSEELLSLLYGSDESFFLVNGSTVGNLASILALCGSNETVLVQRNCHKSIFHGLSIAGSKPVFLPLDIDKKLGQPLGINLSESIKIIKENPNAKAIILTNPNYYGMSQDLTELINIAHQLNVPVIVDEAHGAHFIIGEPFPKSSLEMGADIVIQSAHKTLPAMTMGSYLHVKSNIVEAYQMKEMLRMLQSSSPSYPIMASLDYARWFLEQFSKEKVVKLQRNIQLFIDQLDNLPTIEVVTSSNLSYKQDLLKVIVKSKLGHSGSYLQGLLEKESVYTELSDWAHVLLILPLDPNENFKEHIERISRATSNLLDVTNELPTISMPNFNSIVMESYAGLKSKRKIVRNLSDALGEISAENIVPYPPGVPILLKGELITEEHIRYILELKSRDITIQNLLIHDQIQIEIFQ